MRRKRFRYFGPPFRQPTPEAVRIRHLELVAEWARWYADNAEAYAQLCVALARLEGRRFA